MTIDRHAQLKALHLHGIPSGAQVAAAWQEYPQGTSGRLSLIHNRNRSYPHGAQVPEVWLDRLISAEQADRQARSLNYQLHAAKLPHLCPVGITAT